MEYTHLLELPNQYPATNNQQILISVIAFLRPCTLFKAEFMRSTWALKGVYLNSLFMPLHSICWMQLVTNLEDKLVVYYNVYKKDNNKLISWMVPGTHPDGRKAKDINKDWGRKHRAFWEKARGLNLWLECTAAQGHTFTHICTHKNAHAYCHSWECEDCKEVCSYET